MTTRRIIACSLAASALGLGLLILGLFVDASRAWISYLQVWTFGVTICIGALILLMIGHAAKASWMVITRRLTEAVVDAMPLYLLLSVPIAFALARIYPWAGPK
ncbi:MAG: hypothetical protein ACREJ3_13455, partial [Polyangiaceae bacterium]